MNRAAACSNTPSRCGARKRARTTKLYDRRSDKITLDEVERIVL
jgi:hypothetical protein